jgi:hypothetical protein
MFKVYPESSIYGYVWTVTDEQIERYDTGHSRTFIDHSSYDTREEAYEVCEALNKGETK